MEHDNSYKLLFSHARMVEDLLRGFIQEPWVQEVDFTTLERVSESHVSAPATSARTINTIPPTILRNVFIGTLSFWTTRDILRKNAAT